MTIKGQTAWFSIAGEGGLRGINRVYHDVGYSTAYVIVWATAYGVVSFFGCATAINYDIDYDIRYCIDSSFDYAIGYRIGYDICYVIGYDIVCVISYIIGYTIIHDMS